MGDIDLNKYQLAWKKGNTFQAEGLSESEILKFIKRPPEVKSFTDNGRSGPVDKALYYHYRTKRLATWWTIILSFVFTVSLSQDLVSVDTFGESVSIVG